MIHRDPLLLVLHHFILCVVSLRPNILSEHYTSTDALIQGLHSCPFCKTQPRKQAQTWFLTHACVDTSLIMRCGTVNVL